jgi:hypothetical protein
MTVNTVDAPVTAQGLATARFISLSLLERRTG